MTDNSKLFELIDKGTIVECVTEAFNKLNKVDFGGVKLSEMNVSKQVICGLFHELIVHEIAKIPGWYAGKQKVEADLAHTSGLQLQVKTSTNISGIAGNRYSSKNQYSDPSEFYLCVNYIPFVGICKIRAGFVQATSWNPQSGSGNAASLGKEALDDLCFLEGEYLQNLPFDCIEGIGQSKQVKLKDCGYEKLGDIKGPEDLQKVSSLVRNPDLQKKITKYIHMAQLKTINTINYEVTKAS